ncbi:137_t:CDS:10, partial [Acaulospora colombiana]
MLNVLDVSGPHGVDGIDGVCGYNGTYPSGDGKDGTNATHPTDGGDAGDHTSGAAIEFSGQFRVAGYSFKAFQKSYACSYADLFALKARGGDGGNGGNGGDGGKYSYHNSLFEQYIQVQYRLTSNFTSGNGAAANRITVTIRYSSGTNGGSGGDGGDAGAGTSGADGGDGGTITLTMNDTDSGLLLLFVREWVPAVLYSLDVSGGYGGRAGRHGIPGSGGRGGLGGSSHSWTEVSYSYSNGNRIEHYHNYYNPGGYDGPRGYDGKCPSILLYNGSPGNDGKLRFHIKDSISNKISKYREIFDIRLQSVFSYSATGVFEPEAQIYVDTLTINNSSAMPTPRRDICVTINNNVWISNYAQRKYITLPHRIDGHSSKQVNCNQQLSFFLKKYRVDRPGPPLRATDLLQLTATMTGIQRRLPAFDIYGRLINIQFPIELTHISHMNSMVSGHVAKVIWGVKNTSQVDFGASSKNKRRICVRLVKTGGEVSPHALRFGLQLGQKGVITIPPVQTMEREYIFDIPLLKAVQTLQLEATLALGEAEAFECAEFWIYLELGKIEDPSSLNVVHIQSFDVRVSTIYRGFPAGFYPDVLLVTNHKTTRNEYLAWVNLFKQQLGLKFFVWDISQMGHFSLTRPIETLFSAEPTTLMKDLDGKTIIVLDNEFDYGDYAVKVTARNFVLKHEYLLGRVDDTKEDDESAPAHGDETELSDDNGQCIVDPAKLIDEIFEIQIKPKLFFNMKRRMLGKAQKVDENLKKLRPHILHHVVYNWHDSKISLFRSKKNSDAKTGPLNEDNESDDIYLFLSGRHRMLNEQEKKLAETLKQQIVYDVAVELSTICDGVGSNSSLGGEQTLVMMENLRRLVWKVESLSGNNSTQLGVTDENRLFTISEEHEDASSLNYEIESNSAQLNQGNSCDVKVETEQNVNPKEVAYNCSDVIRDPNNNCSDMMGDQRNDACDVIKDRSNNCSDEIRVIPQNCSDVIINPNNNCSGVPLAHSMVPVHNAPGTTAVGDIGGEKEIIFYMFPVKHDSPLGEWVMDILAQLYAFIKCLRSGIHQSLLPNRRTAKVQQQSMDLLHRIGDATIIDFADPRSSAKLEYIQEQLTRSKDYLSTEDELSTSLEPLTINDEKSERLPSSMNVVSSSSVPSSHNSINADLHNNIQNNLVPTNTSPILYNEFSDLPTPMSIASGLSFASSMTRASMMSSSSFSYSGPSASRSRVPYKKLDSKRRRTIKSFKKGVKLQLRNKIQGHYEKWKK